MLLICDEIWDIFCGFNVVGVVVLSELYIFIFFFMVMDLKNREIGRIEFLSVKRNEVDDKGV